MSAAKHTPQRHAFTNESLNATIDALRAQNKDMLEALQSIVELTCDAWQNRPRSREATISNTARAALAKAGL